MLNEFYLCQGPLNKSYNTGTEGVSLTGQNNNAGVVYTHFKHNYTFLVLL